VVQRPGLEILPVLAETGVVAGAVYDVQRILRDPH
jgi:hypothetical protein